MLLLLSLLCCYFCTFHASCFSQENGALLEALGKRQAISVSFSLCLALLFGPGTLASLLISRILRKMFVIVA